MQNFYILFTHLFTSPILTISEFQYKRNPPPATTNSVCVSQIAYLGNIATPINITIYLDILTSTTGSSTPGDRAASSSTSSAPPSTAAPLAESEDCVTDLPEIPQLQHLSKNRPRKPKRHASSNAAAKVKFIKRAYL